MKYDSIEKLETRLNELLEQANKTFGLSITTDDLLEYIEKTAKDCHSKEELREQMWIESFANLSSSGAAKVQLSRLYLWIIEIRMAQEKGDTERAEKYIKNAADVCKDIDEDAAADFYVEQEKEQNREIAREGGKAKANKKI